MPDLRTGPERAAHKRPAPRTTVSLAEMFGPVLQGEGVTAGVPSVFIRFSACNLLCGGHNGGMVGKRGPDGEIVNWWCDTEVVWKSGLRWTHEEVKNFLNEIGEYDRVMLGTTHIIFTGGEPTMPNNTYDFMALMDYLISDYGELSNPTVEVETNGSVSGPHLTQLLSKPYLKQINCSVKLANSGMPYSMRVRPEALDQIAAHPNHWWKFVVSAPEDLEYALKDYAHVLSRLEERARIVVMPAGSTTEELNQTSQMAWDLATKYNVRYSDRLQVRVWEMATGK